MQGESKISSFLFLLVKGKNGRVGFKIFLHGSKDGRTQYWSLEAVKNVVG